MSLHSAIHDPAFIRRTCWWMGACLLGMILTGQIAARETPPHIVVLLADDLGWGDVGYHGSRIATPHLDQLARRGTRLNQFYVQPVCTPTRGAFLTGRYPMRLGLQCGVVRPWAEHGLPLQERTLPSALKQAGYRTAIIGKWHLGHHRREFLPTQRGFDQQYGHYNGALDYFTHIRDGGWDWHRNDRRNDDEGYTTDLIAREAIRILETHDKATPLFLYVPFNAPHTPLQAPEDYLEQYADWPDRQRATYAAMVSCMDKAVGDILAALETNAFPAEKTLVFFCSDNGGIRRFGSNGELRAEKGRLYEGGIRVPAIVAMQGRVPADHDLDTPLHIVDLYPTLLSLASAPTDQPQPVDGLNVWPAITDGQPISREFLLHNVTPFGGALRMGDWKLVHNGQVPANSVSGSPEQRWELFNIADDPSEKINLYDAHPQIAARLRRKLEELAEAAVPPNIPPNEAPPGFQVPAVWGEPQ